MAGVSILSKVEGQAECFLSKLKVKCASRELREPEQDSANQISEASWLRVKRGPEEQGSEALLCPVLQDVTALSSSSLCATWALPVGSLGLCAADCPSLVLGRDSVLVALLKQLL